MPTPSRAHLLSASATVVALTAGFGGPALVGSDGTRPPAPSLVSTPAPPRSQAGTASVTLRVTGRRRQKIDGWGASIVSNTKLDPQAQPVGLSRRQLVQLDDAVFDRAGINLLRIFGPGFVFPDAKAPPSEGKLRAQDGRWKLMRRARRRGVKLLFTASNAPSSMKHGNRLAADAERRFARYVAANLAYARRLGAPFTLAAIGNEIDYSESPLQMDAAQAAKVYGALPGEIRRRRLRTRLALGDTVNWAGGARYAGEALRSRRVRRYAKVLATHGYGGDSSRGELGSVARRGRLRIWMTEWTGARCPNGDCADRPDMDFALRWAGQITRDLQQPGVTAWFVFRAVDDSTHGPDSGIIVRTRDDRSSPFYLTKRFHVLRQFTSAAPPGARRLEVSGGLPALAFRRGRRLALVVTNADGHEVTGTLALGRRRGTVAVRRTSGHENFRRLATQAYDGRSLPVRLPPASVTTFTLAAPGNSR